MSPSSPLESTSSLNSDISQDVTIVQGSTAASPLIPTARDSQLPLKSPYNDETNTINHGTRGSRPQLSPYLHQGRRPSFIEEDEQPMPSEATIERGKDEAPVTWMSLPQKSQLAVLTLARLSEPLSERSLSAYMYYQLRWFDSTLPEDRITSQGGMLTAAFAAAQFLTAVWWGRAADSAWIGRKRVILIGLFGTCLSTIGVGFSKSFAQAFFFRIMAGALNGNVGVMRTMISEIIKEKKFQSRAFLLLPMCFNVGVVIGPILGGFLADPIQSFPNVFGPGSAIGGKDGVGWMTAFPYALPNLFSGIFICMSALGIILGLDETHEALKDKPDRGRQLGKYLVSLIRRQPTNYQYTALENDEETINLDDHSPTTPIHHQTRSQPPATTPTTTPSSPPKRQRLPFRKIFTKNVILTLLTHHLLALHISSFNALIFLLLPAPRSNNTNAHLPFRFTGGLGLTTEKVGLATAIIGVIGFPLQILVYPGLNTRLGTLPAYKIFLPFSILAYLLLPFLSLLPDKAYIVWPCLAVVLACQVMSRTFALPGATILVNNSTPHPSVLGTIHGFAQSISSGARTVGPILGGWGLGMGLRNNCVGAVWWAMAGVALVNWSLLFTIFEGDAGYADK